MMLAGVLLAAAWPPGGGQGEGSLAIAQGASLIFVVILVGLMSGPIEASTRLGRGTDWVTRDAPTWLGLGWVALLSIVLLAIGWSEPDRQEELATIAITAAGLGATGLVARRLLRLSDPAAQLDDLYRRSVERVRAVLVSDRRTTDEALKLAEVEAQVSTKVSRFASEAAQQQVAETLQGFTSVAAVAWRDGDWALAARAHFYATAVAREYLSRVRAVDGSDRVVTTLVNETDDLHELAGGPDGRKLSQTLVTGLSQLGRDISLRSDFASDGHNDAVFRVAYELGTVLTRRLADQKSTDPAAAIRGLGDIAVGCAGADAAWGAISTNERLLDWAAMATNANVVHVAHAAWEESIRVTVTISKVLEPDSRSMLFEAALRDFEQALRRVESFPPWSAFSSLGPLLRSSTDGAHATLQVSFYLLWGVGEPMLKPLTEFGRHIAYGLTTLLTTAPERSRRNLSAEVGEVLYQWMAATATRAAAHPPGDSIHDLATGSIANTLGWLRSLLVSEGEVQEQNDLHDLLHMYVSGWEMLLYVLRQAPGLPETTSGEFEKLVAVLDDSVLSEMPEELRATLDLLATWLDRIGASAEAIRAREKAGSILRRAPSPWGPPTAYRWGMSGDYFTRRGGLVPAVVADVEMYFRPEERRRSGGSSEEQDS